MYCPSKAPTPAPAKGPYIAPIIGAAYPDTSAAAFLVLLPISRTAFFNLLVIDFKKNSGCPVKGLIELNSLPTTYLSG